MRTTISVVALCLLTAACGSNVEQRSSTGALTGAGVGALAGGPIGAVVGAAVGGLGGAATPIGANQAFNKALGISHQSVAQSNFPPPPGSNAATTASGSSMPATTTSTTTAVPMSRQTVRKIQRSLRQAGDNPGPIDGVVGPRTRSALRQYQQKEGLPATGSLDAQTVQRLAANTPSQQGTSRSGQQGSSQPMGANETGSNQQNQQGTTGSGQQMGAASMQGNASGELNGNEVKQRLEAAGYTNVTGVQNAGGGDYHARADRGNATYALYIDGKTGTIKSLRQVSGGAPSTGSSAPGATQNGQTGSMPSDQGGATGSGTQAQPGQGTPAPGSQPQQ